MKQLLNNAKGDLTIYNMRLAAFIMGHGYPIRELKENFNYPGIKVFYFENCPEVKDLMSDWIIKHKNN